MFKSYGVVVVGGGGGGGWVAWSILVSAPVPLYEQGGIGSGLGLGGLGTKALGTGLDNLVMTAKTDF